MHDANYTRSYMALSCDQSVLADSMLARLHATATASVSSLSLLQLAAAVTVSIVITCEGGYACAVYDEPVLQDA